MCLVPVASQKEAGPGHRPYWLRVALQDPTVVWLLVCAPQHVGRGTKLALWALSQGPSQPHHGLHRASSGATLSSSIVVFRAGQARVTVKESCRSGQATWELLHPLLPWGLPSNGSGVSLPRAQ